MFTSARIKLTAWYLLIVTFLSLSFSIVIYQSLTGELNRISRMHELRIERRIPNLPVIPNSQPLPRGMMSNYLVDPDLINETKHRIIIYLIIFNCSVLIISGGLGYFLAGKTLSPIEKMLDQQHRFISDASHELKTPLSSLKTTFEVFLRDPKQTFADANNLVKDSIEEVNKLQSLAESLLTLSRYDAQDSQPHQSHDVKPIIKNVIKSFNSRLKKQDIKIKQNLSSACILGQTHELVQLFTIIIDNAIKFSPAQSQINIDLKLQKKYLQISIHDQGIGISADDLPYVFNRFYQSELTRTKTHNSGYGLGLSIAKEIVNHHKGTISISSQEGQGTNVNIRFPLITNSLK